MYSQEDFTYEGEKSTETITPMRIYKLRGPSEDYLINYFPSFRVYRIYSKSEEVFEGILDSVLPGKNVEERLKLLLMSHLNKEKS